MFSSSHTDCRPGVVSVSHYTTSLPRPPSTLVLFIVLSQEEVKRIQSVPLVIGQFLEAIDESTGT